MSWVWSDARKATITYIVGSVLLPYLSRSLPGIGAHMTTPVFFTIASTLTSAPIRFTLPVWELVAIALLMLVLLVNTMRLLGREVHVCTYCLSRIGPFTGYMVLPGRPSERAHPRCYARNNQTSVNTPTGLP